MSFVDEFVAAAQFVEDAFALPVIERAGELFLESIKDGSEISGAPGQPVDTGALYASWEIVVSEDGSIVVFSELPYAWGIEHGVGPFGPIQLRSRVGGFHSVALTFTAGDRLVERAALDILGRFDGKIGRYRGRGGRFVSRDRLRAAYHRRKNAEGTK